jgi:hypothetical protein
MNRFQVGMPSNSSRKFCQSRFELPFSDKTLVGLYCLVQHTNSRIQELMDVFSPVIAELRNYRWSLLYLVRRADSRFRKGCPDTR